jgi:glycosyltransferase involved in cell wall biosynthesis
LLVLTTYEGGQDFTLTNDDGEVVTVTPGSTIQISLEKYETLKSYGFTSLYGFERNMDARSFKDGYIRYASAMNTVTGYGTQGYQIMRNLVDSGLHVTFEHLTSFARPTLDQLDPKIGAVVQRKDRNNADWGIVHSVVEALPYMETPNTIMWTMWEADRLPGKRVATSPYSNWTETINEKAQAVIVPATEQRRIFLESGVDKPVHVVHDAIDTKKWAYKPRTGSQSRPFTFGAYGFLNSRKAPLETVNAFLSAFGPNNPNVRLVMKTMAGQFGGGAAAGIPRHNWANVEIIDDVWPEERLRHFVYNEVDAFVFNSRGEGFYDPPLEALSAGVPVIVADHSGAHDYADPSYMYPIRLKGMEEAPQASYMKWWTPDYDHLVSLMHQVYRNYDEALDKAKRGSKWVAKRWSIEHQRTDLMKVLNEVCT